MKYVFTVFLVVVLVGGAQASWPFMELDLAEVRRDPERTLRPILESRYEYLYFSAPDFRKATVNYHKEKKGFSCHFPVSYVEAADWLTLDHVDRDKAGWTPLPNDLESDAWRECAAMAHLMAVLDDSEIRFERTTSVRRERGTDRFLAAWNRLEFRVPLTKKDSLITFLRLYLGGYPPDTKIDLYNTQS